jgi:hypothetical protein
MSEKYYVILTADNEPGDMPEKFEAYSASLTSDGFKTAYEHSRTSTVVQVKVKWPEAKMDMHQSIRMIAWHGPIDLGWGGCAMDVGGVLDAIHPVAVKAIEEYLES